MAIVIESIDAMPDPGNWLVRVNVDGKELTARVEAGIDSASMMIEEPLFFLLSDRGLAEVGNSAAFQASLCNLVRSVSAGQTSKLPFVMGLDCFRKRRRWWKLWSAG